MRVCRQGTEAKTHQQPELQADGPPSSTSTFHTHASSETALHTRCVRVPLYFLRMMSTQCLQKRRLRRISLLPVHPSKRKPARVSSYYMAHSNCSSIQHFKYSVFRSSVMIDIAHVSSHTATQDRHGHTPRHCWHTTHKLGSTEHPPFARSRTTQHSSQPPQSTVRSAHTTPHQRATQCEYAGKALKRKHIISLSCKPTAHPRRPHDLSNDLLSW